MDPPHILPRLPLLLLLLFCCIASPTADVRYPRHFVGRGTRDMVMMNTTEEEMIVIRGHEVLLECNVPQYATPVPGDDSIQGEVRWFHNGKRLREDLRASVMWTGRLRFSKTVVSDSGLWWCRRSGRPGPRTKISVVIPPERPYLEYSGNQVDDGDKITTKEGDKVILHCLVEGGNPEPKISWLLSATNVTADAQVHAVWIEEDGQYRTISNYTISSTRRDHHNATVACIMTHPSLSHPISATITLNIQYSPNFRIRRWPVWGMPVRVGSAVSLLCHVDANPSSTPTWVKETSGGSREVSSTDGWLNLTKVLLDDRGWYKCATTHTFGHFASHSVFINIRLGEEDGAGGGIHTPQLLRKSPDTLYTIQPALQQPCTTHLPGSGWVKVIAVNSSVVTVGGSSAVLTARVCGHPLPTHNSLTWLHPPHLTPITPLHSTHRLIAHNLTSVTRECGVASLSVSRVRNSDAGSWVLVVTGHTEAAATLVRLNVTDTGHTTSIPTSTILLSTLLSLYCLVWRS